MAMVNDVRDFLHHDGMNAFSCCNGDEWTGCCVLFHDLLCTVWSSCRPQLGHSFTALLPSFAVGGGRSSLLLSPSSYLGFLCNLTDLHFFPLARGPFISFFGSMPPLVLWSAENLWELLFPDFKFPASFLHCAFIEEFMFEPQPNSSGQ